MTFVSQFRESGGTLTTRSTPNRTLTTVRADELMALDFPPFVYLVADLIPNGLTILAGAPKIGKSWMALGLAIAVASGQPALGKLATHRYGVLYAALEDNHRRLQRRFQKLSATAPENLHFVTQLPSVSEDLVDRLREWLTGHPDVKFVIIDTLARIRPANSKANDYLEDTRTLQDLQQLANDLEIAILLITHTRKAEALDAFDEVLGSRGLTGVADTILVVRRGRNQADAVIAITGRDVEEREIALSFNHHSATWVFLGDAASSDVTPERERLLQAVGAAGPAGIGPADLAKRLGDNENNVKVMLHRALTDGQLERPTRGTYVLATPTGNAEGHTTNDE
jgi:hypothetical protein